MTNPAIYRRDDAPLDFLGFNPVLGCKPSERSRFVVKTTVVFNALPGDESPG